MILYVISVGLSVDDGPDGFINLAHGVFAMAGGYILSTAMARFGIPFPWRWSLPLPQSRWRASCSSACSTPAFMRLASCAGAVLHRPHPHLHGGGAPGLWKPRGAVFLPDYLRGQVHVLGRDFPTYRVFLIIFSALIIVGLWFGVERTRWGRWCAPRRQPRHGASVGINTRLLFMATFALAAASPASAARSAPTSCRCSGATPSSTSSTS